jgi:uncharacterized protein with PIN domain
MAAGAVMKPAFAADRTLGKLVKWLRLMGFDTVFESDATADGFRAFNPADRIYLTRIRRRDFDIPAGRLVCVAADDLDSQLMQVISQLKLDCSMLKPFSRCLRCNEEIVAISPSRVAGAVPDHVWETHTVFSQCPRCRRIYWSGSHVERSRQQLTRYFKGPVFDRGR